MSSTDDAAFRLSSALEAILAKAGSSSPAADAAPPTADWSVDDDEVGASPAAPGSNGGAGAAAAFDPANTAFDTADADAAVGPAAADAAVETEPYVLPEIVPATVDVPEPPNLPVAETMAPTVVAPAPATAPVTSWTDHVAPIPANAQGAPLRAPGRRPRVRRVTRVLRHIDPWSTFKVGLVFSLVAYVVFLTAGVLLWRVADETGTLTNVERWFTQFGWETFELKGGEIFHNAWIIGLFGVVATTGGLVLLATLFNLVSDIVGGVRLTVLEEEVVERTVSSTRRYVVRRGPSGAGVAQDWDVDAERPAVDTDSVTADWSVD